MNQLISVYAPDAFRSSDHRFVGVDVPLGHTGHARRQNAAGQTVIEVAGLPLALAH